MKSAIIIVVCSFWIASAKSAENNFTFTYEMAMRCKEHLCTHGYSYEQFYRLDSAERRPQGAGAALEMHLAIMAASNGHVLLSTVPRPEPSDPVYEIVVGGGGNKFTELRRNLRRNAKASATTPKILSAIELRAFYVRITEDGVIEFGREGDPLPLLSYNDVNPITVKYFSFAAWNGVEAKFLYDCPAPGDYGNETSPDSQEVEEKLSNSEQLKRTLLMDRLPNLPPDSPVRVRLGVRITSVKYNAFESKLATGLAVVTSWTDDSMAWDVSKFNGTTRLTFRQGQIWRPSFFAFNSDDVSILDTRNPDLISMVHSGDATFHFQTQIYTWCYDYSEGINRWPRDEYTCSIMIGAWETHEKITLEEISQYDEKMEVFADIDEVIQNEWETTTRRVIATVAMWNQVFPILDNKTHQSDRLIINVNLKRRAESYNVAFYTPLLVLIMFVLMSFWNETMQNSRIWFYTASTIFICMGLCFIDYLVPCHTIPTILILYTTVLMGILIALLIQVVMMTSVMKKLCKTVLIQTALTSKWVRIVFCLPEMKTCRIYESINEGFATQEDDDSGVVTPPRNGNVEEMQTDDNEYGEREELAEAIDKLMFVVYTVVFAVVLALHY